MKRVTFFISTLILGSLFFLLSSSKTSEKPMIEVFDENFRKDYVAYLKSLSEFQNAIIQNQNVNDKYFVLREKFKQIEFVIAHFDSELHKLHINGAPLPTIAISDNDVSANEPEGIQVIDEFIGERINDENREEALAKLKNLIRQSTFFKGIYSNTRPSDRLILEAIRKDLLRVVTLSITGFDTPGSVNALPDAIVSLSTQQKYLQPYIERSGKFQEINDLYAESINYIKENNDFDTFDRLYFITEFFNPIFELTYKLHKDLEIETIDEVLPYPQPWNYNETQMFSENFISRYASTHQRPQHKTDDIKELGRTLFYDPILSSNNKRACGSCHNPKLAFTDGMKKSLGMDFNGTVERNAMALIDCAYTDGFFYDLKAMNLEAQFEHVISNPKEFDTSWKEIIEKLNTSSEYKELFTKNFKEDYEDPINPHTIQIALTQFVVSLTSFDSEFDKYVRGELASISDEVRNGFNIFMGKGACGTCHFAPTFNGLVPPNFTDMETEVLGTPIEKDGELVLDDDPGRSMGRIKERVDFYNRSFKTVTVRNAELTGPYMHNGVYETLEEVMDFYNKGGGVGLGFDVPNQTLPFDSLSLNPKEISDVIAFMKALTDTTGLTDMPVSLPKFANEKLNDRKIGGEY